MSSCVRLLRRRRLFIDLTGGPPQHDTFDPADLTATFLLGIAPDVEIHDAAGRPYRACHGTPVRGLLCN